MVIKIPVSVKTQEILEEPKGNVRTKKYNNQKCETHWTDSTAEWR